MPPSMPPAGLGMMPGMAMPNMSAFYGGMGGMPGMQQMGVGIQNPQDIMYQSMQQQHPMMNPAMMGMGFPGMMAAPGMQQQNLYGQTAKAERFMEPFVDPNFQQMQQQLSTRILINQQEQGPDGSLINKEQQMDVILNEASNDSIMMFNKATMLISQGQNQEGMGLIMNLYNQKKVAIIPVTAESSISGSLQYQQ
eukprot:403367339